MISSSELLSVTLVYDYCRRKNIAQIPIFICLPCLFWYPPDNLCRMSGTGRCWGVWELRWDEGWLYYHFKSSACQVLWFHSSLTCQASLTGSHHSPVLLRAPGSPLLWMTAAVTSSYSSRFPIFLPPYAPCSACMCWRACKGKCTRCKTSHDWTCLGCGTSLAFFSLLSKGASSGFRTAPGLGLRGEIRCSLLCLQRCLWGKRDRL